MFEKLSVLIFGIEEPAASLTHLFPEIDPTTRPKRRWRTPLPSRPRLYWYLRSKPPTAKLVRKCYIIMTNLSFHRDTEKSLYSFVPPSVNVSLKCCKFKESKPTESKFAGAGKHDLICCAPLFCTWLKSTHPISIYPSLIESGYLHDWTAPAPDLIKVKSWSVQLSDKVR